jgi:hypothetical protein
MARVAAIACRHSRMENAASKPEAARLAAALLDQFGTAVTPGKQEIWDVDDVDAGGSC